MAKVKSKQKYNKPLTNRKNYFSEGGKTDLMGSIGQIGMAAASDISNMINNIQSKDITQKADNLISNINSNQLGVQSSNDSFDALSNDWANTANINHVTAQQMGASNFGQGFGQAFAAGNKGFAAGSGLGPIGAAASAIGSTVTSIIGTVGRNRRAKKEAARINEAIDYANDFNQKSLVNRATNLIDQQAAGLEANYAAFGGDLQTHGANFDTGLTLIGNGGTHEANPYEGVPMGVDQEGTPNLVEEGEVIFNGYVYSKRVKVPKAVRNKYKLRGNKPLTFADAALQISKEAEERPNDPISKNGLYALLGELASVQETIRQRKTRNQFKLGGQVNKFDDGGTSYPDDLLQNSQTAEQEETPPIIVPPTRPSGGIPSLVGNNTLTPPDRISTMTVSPNKDQNSTMPNFNSVLRYAPALGAAIGLGTSLFSKPDESSANAILEASKSAGQYSPISFNTIGNYLSYNPFDVEAAANQANAESAAARRAIMNTSGGNRAQAMAGVLAADNNALNKLGILRREAAQDNLKQRQITEEFNRGTNQFNSEGLFKADAANQSSRINAGNTYLSGVTQAEAIRQNAKLAREQSISANLSGLFNSLGNLGSEDVARQQYKWLYDNGYVRPHKSKFGGKIKRRKQGLTY